MEEIGEYFNSITESVKSVFVKHPELAVSGRGRQVLKEVQNIYPEVNPDSVLRAYRQLRSNKDFKAEQEWRVYFKNNAKGVRKGKWSQDGFA